MPGFVVIILKILSIVGSILFNINKGPGRAALDPSNAIVPVSDGKMGERDYSIVAGMRKGFEVWLQLKGNTNLHIKIIGSKSLGKEEAVHSAKADGLRQIHLEGHFPSYFKVFTKPDTEQETLQLLDPATMIYLVDYCKSYHVDILGSSMRVGQYIGSNDEKDKTSMLTDLEELVRKNELFIRKLEKQNPIAEYDPRSHYKGTKPFDGY